MKQSGGAGERGRRLSAGEATVRAPTSPFLHTPSAKSSWTGLLPDTLHYGAGIEASLTEPKAPLTGVGLGLKFEFNVFAHSMGLGLQDESQLGLTIDAAISRPNLDLALLVSF